VLAVAAAKSISVRVASDADIVSARLAGRNLAEQIGFRGGDIVIIATAISEVARNIVEYAKEGEIILNSLEHGVRHGIQIVARDHGPGIADIDQAMQNGYSTAKGLGLGLPGARRLMDEFEIRSEKGVGTIVTMKKWLK
jgi:serine/threonine-protein kinase RsbT